MKELEVVVRKPEGESKGPIILLHGACHGAWCWENYLNYFPMHGYEVCALSLPGHGKSWGCGTDETVTYQDYYDAVESVLTQYGGQVVLVGHSLGGTIAQKVMFDHPELVKGGVLMATGIVPWLNNSEEEAKELQEFFNTPAFASIMKAMSGQVPKNGEELSQSGFFSGRVSAEEADKWCDKLVVEKAKYSSDFGVTGKTMDVPLLALATDCDTCSPLSHQQKIAASYDAKLVVLHGLCHDMMLDPEWEVSAQAILDYLQDLNDMLNLD